ncbi:MAG: hypothetical protein ACLVAW_05370 [Eisenbergiella massiliensis]
MLIIPTVYLTIFILLYYQCRLDTRLQNEAILNPSYRVPTSASDNGKQKKK